MKLSQEDSRDIIELLARKRNTKSYKRKSNDKLLQAIKENKTNKQQPRNKKTVDSIREDLKDLSYKLSKRELQKIRRNLYNIEKTKQFNKKKTNKYLDELNKKILKLETYHDHDDYEYRGIKNIKDLFKLSIDKNYYKATLVKSGYNGNYIQYESKGDKILTLKEYLALIEKYLRKLINYYKNKGEWKVQLIAEISLISLKPGSNETRILHTRSDNEEFMNGSDTDEIIEGFLNHFYKNMKKIYKKKMEGSDFELDSANFLYYDFNKISINKGGSYIDSPQWLKNKKSTINPINNDYKCFQYAVTLALNLDKIRKSPQRISKIKPFIDQYNWKYIDFPATSKVWKKFELNNEIALNILYVPDNTRKIYVAYKSKHNLTRENQIILLMITDGEKWHYLTVKNLSGLLRGITSIHAEDFYCLNCFCAHCSFDNSKNNLNYYRGEDFMKKFCKDLRIHATKIINYEKKKMISLTIKEEIYRNKQKICYICKKEFNKNDKKQQKVRDHCHYTGKYRGAAHNICNLRYKVPKEIPVVFHNGSTYDYHFIIKELVKEFEGNFECLGENTEKYITFSVPLKEKIENKNIEITYNIKFIDSYRFMSSSLSKLVDNLSEGIHNNKCADCESCLDYVPSTKNEKLIFKCFNCEQYYKRKINKDLIKTFVSTYEFCNKDLNKFILLLRKGVYPYEYMDSWERFNKTSLPRKEDFYSNLSMENIDDIDYRHGKNVFKRFELENLDQYHDLYVQSDTLLLAGAFENFRDMCIKEYELDPAHFLSLPGLAWQACLKKTNIE